MDRSIAMEALRLRIENEHTIQHSLAVEAIMRKLADYFHEDAELWGIAGLVHDIDIERIQKDMKLHGLMGGDILEDLNFDETIVYAVRAHNPDNHYKRRRRIDKALYCAEPMSSFIMSCRELLAEKNLEKLDKTFALQCFENHDLITAAKHCQIAVCSELGLSLEKFFELSIMAIKKISPIRADT